MNDGHLEPLRTFLRRSLKEAGDAADLADGDSLFASGRLDSLALTQLVLFLEDEYALDFSRLDFSADLVDSVQAIRTLLPPLPEVSPSR